MCYITSYPCSEDTAYCMMSARSQQVAIPADSEWLINSSTLYLGIALSIWLLYEIVSRS